MLTRRGALPLLAAAPAMTWAVWNAVTGDVDASNMASSAGASSEGATSEGATSEGATSYAVARTDGFHAPETPTTRLWRALIRTRPAMGPSPAAIEPTVAALDGETVTLTGFPVPTGSGRRFHRFLFAANPPGCPGCSTRGIGRIIEARTIRPLTITGEPITLTGTFRVRRDTGLIFKLDGAATT